MKRFVSAVMLVTAAFLVFGPSLALAQKSDNVNAEKLIAQLEDDWANAMVKADLIALDRIIAPEWTMADPGQT
jgi:hypothetical protein